MQRRIAVLRGRDWSSVSSEERSSVLLYRIDSTQSPTSYPNPRNPMYDEHPLRLLYEHLLMGRVPPPVMALQQITGIDAVVAAFIYLYPDRANHPEVGVLVDIVCRFERWGAVGTFPNVAPDHRYVLQALREVVPSEADHREMGDDALTDLLVDAVQVLHGSFPLEVKLTDLEGVESVAWETDRIAVVIASPDAPADLPDGLFLAGKFVGAVLWPQGDRTSAMLIRRSVLVQDVSFDALFRELAFREAGWQQQTALALVGPAAGSVIPVEEFVDLLQAATTIC